MTLYFRVEKFESRFGNKPGFFRYAHTGLSEPASPAIRSRTRGLRTSEAIGRNEHLNLFCPLFPCGRVARTIDLGNTKVMGNS